MRTFNFAPVHVDTPENIDPFIICFSSNDIKRYENLLAEYSCKHFHVSPECLVIVSKLHEFYEWHILMKNSGLKFRSSDITYYSFHMNGDKAKLTIIIDNQIEYILHFQIEKK